MPAKQMPLPFLETQLSESLLAHPRMPLLGVWEEDLRDLTTPLAGGILTDYLGKTHFHFSCAMNLSRDMWFVSCENQTFNGRFLGEACAKALLHLWANPIPVREALQPLEV